jgi:hypothetical protein
MFENNSGGSAMARSALVPSTRAVQTGAAGDPQRLSAVAREVRAARDVGAALHEVIDRLEARLAPVLSDAPPNTVDKALESPIASTDLARELQSLNSTSSAVGRRLSALLDRIDL